MYVVGTVDGFLKNLLSKEQYETYFAIDLAMTSWEHINLNNAFPVNKLGFISYVEVILWTTILQIKSKKFCFTRQVKRLPKHIN